VLRELHPDLIVLVCIHESHGGDRCCRRGGAALEVRHRVNVCAQSFRTTNTARTAIHDGSVKAVVVHLHGCLPMLTQ
jgi:hypothetical protein